VSGHATARHPVSQDALRSSTLRSIASGSPATAAATHDSKSIIFSSQPAEPPSLTGLLQDAPATLHSSGSRDARVRAVNIQGAPFRRPRARAGAHMRSRNLPHTCWLHRRKEGVTHPSGCAEPRQWHIPRPSPGARCLPTLKACRRKASFAARGTSGGRLSSFQNSEHEHVVERQRKSAISVSSAGEIGHRIFMSGLARGLNRHAGLREAEVWQRRTQLARS